MTSGGTIDQTDRKKKSARSLTETKVKSFSAATTKVV
jgi:hypothetical protein